MFISSDFFHHKESTLAVIKTILKIAIPSAIRMLFLMLAGVINTIFIGQLNDPVILAAAGLGSMTSSILGLSIIIGINGALDTFIS